MIDHLERRTLFSAGITLDDNGLLVIEGTAGHDRIVLEMRTQPGPSTEPTGELSVRLNGTTRTFSKEQVAGIRRVVIRAGAGNDVVSVSGRNPVSTIIRTGAAGFIPLSETHLPLGVPAGIHGNSGNDTLLGGAAADEIPGGRGRDVLAGGDGADSLFGGRGNDRLNSAAPSGLFIAGDPPEIGSTDGHRDVLNGGPGTDTYEAERIDRLSNVEPAPGVRTFTGILQSTGGIETTGWALGRDRGGWVPLNLDRFEDVAISLHGKRVTVSGRFYTWEGVETGAHVALRVISIAPAASKP